MAALLSQRSVCHCCCCVHENEHGVFFVLFLWWRTAFGYLGTTTIILIHTSQLHALTIKASMQQIAHDGDQGEQDQEAQHFQRRAATIAERSMSLLSNDFVTASNDDFTPEDLLLEVTAQVLDTPFASDTFTTATGALDGVSTSSVEAAAADVLGRATTSSSDYTDNDSERGSKKRSSSSLDASMGTATDPNSHTATHSHTPKSKTRKPRYLVQKVRELLACKIVVSESVCAPSWQMC